MITKKCSKCEQVMEADKFRKSKRMKDGLQTWCLSCSRAFEAEVRLQKRNETYKPNRRMGPSIKDRDLKFKEGYSWCTDCQKWLKLSSFPMNRAATRLVDNKCRKCSTRRANIRAKIPRFAYRNQVRHAAYRQLDFSLSMEEFLSFQNQACHYCNEKIDGFAIDRLDSSLGYTLQNCVPCCKGCNIMKNNLSINDFINKINKIYNHLSPQVSAMLVAKL